MGIKTIVISSLLGALVISSIAFCANMVLSENTPRSVTPTPTPVAVAKTPLEEAQCFNNGKIAAFTISMFEGSADRLSPTVLKRTAMNALIMMFGYSPEMASMYVSGSWELYEAGMVSSEARDKLYATCMNLGN